MNLFICNTTLHLFVAKKIIIDEKLTNVDVIFLGVAEIERNQYYLDTLKDYTNNLFVYSNLFSIASEASSRAKTNIAKKIKKDVNKKYENVFISQYSDRFYHMILSYTDFNNLFTFDDGVINFNSISHYVKITKKPHISRRLYGKIKYGRKYFSYDVVRLSKMHYTFFNHDSPTFENTKYLQLVTINTNRISNEKKQIGILVGGLYSNILKNSYDQNSFVKKINKIIEQHNISLYLPHPGDEYAYFNCETLVSNKISEEIISEYLSAGYDVALYGFGSTIQYNETINNATTTNVVLYSSIMTEDALYIATQVFGKQYKHINLDKI